MRECAARAEECGETGVDPAVGPKPSCGEELPVLVKLQTPTIVQRRILAVLLGCQIALAACGLFLGWHATYSSGTETCIDCRAEREFDRRGPFSWHSEVKTPRSAVARASRTCTEHDWRRSGCWRTGSGVECHGLPTR